MMKAKIEMYDSCKYNASSNVIHEVEYDDIVSYEVKDIPDEEILKSFDMTDDYHEYLILTFADGTTSTFRNSYADMFLLH